MAYWSSSIYFKSAQFNSAQPRDYFINPRNFGDDVGSWLKPRLAEKGFVVSGPDQEDWGWYLTLTDTSGHTANINIGFGGGPDDTEFQVFVVAGSGLLGWLLGRSKAAHAAGASAHQAVLQILESDASIALIRE